MNKIAVGAVLFLTVMVPPWRINCIPHSTVLDPIEVYGTGSFCAQRFGFESFLGWNFIRNAPTMQSSNSRIQTDLNLPTPPRFEASIDWQILILEWCLVVGFLLAANALTRRLKTR